MKDIRILFGLGDLAGIARKCTSAFSSAQPICFGRWPKGMADLTLQQAKDIVNNSNLPWNPMQNPQWHLAQWKASVIWDLEQAMKKNGEVG
jgi:hypothetical protein